MMIKYTKVPILYSYAYHAMHYSKEDPNECAKEFLDYLRKVGTNTGISKDAANQVNGMILRVQDQKHCR